MQRLRKKSDRISTFPVLHSSNSSSFAQSSEDEHLLPLPSSDTFRTSLILPELARRFTLLRTPSGNPVSLVDIRLKFAEQRATGALNQVSETEEDMILQTLGRIRSKHAASTTQLNRDDPNPTLTTETGVDSDYTPERSSHLSSSTSTIYPSSSVTSSPRSTKRYSNNFFSSGRLRDYGYLRTISQRSHRSAVSVTHTESSQSLREVTSLNSIDSLRPTTPEGAASTSPPSSPNDKTPVARTASLISSNEDLPPQSGQRNGSGVRLSKRASAALAQVIKEFEEPEEEIVMPRTTHPAPRPSDPDYSRVASDTKELPETGASLTHDRSSVVYEAGTAISPEGQISIEPDPPQFLPTPFGRPGTGSPTPRLPGYIPGMPLPRPMTPREGGFDTEDIRSHSTTPRASSPIAAANGQNAHSSISSGLLRRGSDPSRSTPRPTSSQAHAAINSYLSRNNSGRRTPEAQRDSTSGIEQEGSVTSSVFVRRRPMSPLSGPAFQPMAVSSRPSTPSNITWTVGGSASPEKVHVKSENRPTHSRSGSQSTETDVQINTDRSKSPTRSLRSPTPHESSGAGQTTTTSKWNNSASPADSRAPSSLSNHDFGSTLNRGLRSPTPTQSRNATSPTFSSPDTNCNTSRSSKQHFKSSFNYSYGVSQLSLSPVANSSRSSLESTGSSYHSWEPNQKISGALDIFSGSIGQTPPTWYGLDKSYPLTPGSSQDECDFEGIIRRYAGLTKSDFVAIQEKLVGAALHKATLPDTRERSNSLRRRRPSTSQSSYSANGRVVSPTPTQNGPAGRRSPALDNNAKASALLESVVDSIPVVVTQVETKVEGNTEPELSPTTRRNRDLARALGFGSNDSDNLIAPQISRSDSSSTSVAVTIEAILPPDSPQGVESVVPLSARLPQSESTLSPGPLPQRSQSMRNPRTVPIDQTELAREVQRRADAATAALMKSSGRKFADVNASTLSVSRKKIDPSQISEPRLLSGPTSVETIPLPTATSPLPVTPQSSLGITQRMRRFRDTLRVKPTFPSGEESTTSIPIDVQPQPASQGLGRRPTLPLSRLGPGSSTELAKLKTASTGAPASAAPGFKKLMARFRRPRTVDGAGDSQSSMHSRSSPTTSSPTASSHQGHARGNVASPTPPTTAGSPSGDTSTRPSLDASTILANNVDSAAVKQLFEAASKIGLDQVALNDLLSRSTSVSRAAGWVWSGGTSATGNTHLTPGTQPSSILDQKTTDKSVNDDPSSGAADKAVRKLSVRKAGDPGHIRQNRQIPENAAVIRRTLIFPSEFRNSKVDLSQANRKAAARRHRRSGSATSAQSARSIHDRAPTPPPPKSNGGRRFSTERSPPVPGLITSIGAQAEALLRAPPSETVAEKPNSTYDSLYDMYSAESKHTSTSGNNYPSYSPTVVDDAGTERDPDGTTVQEGPAVEVIEMANGETIWQIVNGLRDDDIDTLYPSRFSLGSDHSARENENSDGVQVFVKEHARAVSRASSSSINSRKRTSQGKYHPETKVFYSTSAQIGRLIENLSQGMDAGSFDFILNQPPARSAASSLHSDTDSQWTVEEKLEHMLGALRNS